MSIDYTELFTRIGSIVNEVNLNILRQYPQLMGANSGADAILDNFNDRRDLVLGIQESFEGFVEDTQAWSDTLIEVVNNVLADLQIELNAPDSSPETIFPLLIDRMREDKVFIEANFVEGSITTSTDNLGTSDLLVSLNNVDGDLDERILDQTIAVRCDVDRHTGATAGSETFSITGYPVEPPASYKTQGDGTGPAMGTLQASNALSNGDFENWTDDDPDSWTIETGTTPSSFIQETADAYTGDSAAAFVGDGVTLSAEISQNIFDLVEVDTIQCCAFNIKRNEDSEFSATTDGDGTFSVYIRDGVNSDIIIFQSDADEIATSYETKHAFFVMPKDPADEIELVIQWESTTGLPLGAQIVIDNIAIAPATIYGNTAYAIQRGDVDSIRDDNYTVETNNDFDGVFQTFFGRWYDVALPSTRSEDVGSEVTSTEGELIPDSLATG